MTEAMGILFILAALWAVVVIHDDGKRKRRERDGDE
jgi:hypothetical protein